LNGHGSPRYAAESLKDRADERLQLPVVKICTIVHEMFASTAAVAMVGHFI